MFNKPDYTISSISYIDTSKDPVQNSVSHVEPIAVKINNNDFLITPLAEYKVAARVLSRHNYYWGWSANLAPVDLALAWGGIADNDMTKGIKFSQSNRWYYYTYEADSNFDGNYIALHSSNNHIIPANDNVKEALNKVKTDDLIIIEGYLVKVDGRENGKIVFWNTSLTRSDTGDGSCEVIYAKKIQIGRKIYE